MRSIPRSRVGFLKRSVKRRGELGSINSKPTVCKVTVPFGNSTKLGKLNSEYAAEITKEASDQFVEP